jgi:hypothetical protein
VRTLRPDTNVRVVSSRPQADNGGKPTADGEIAIRLVRIEGISGPRSQDAVSSRLQLEYAFDVAFADPVAEQQALADLAFGILERDDLGERSDVVRAENGFPIARAKLQVRDSDRLIVTGNDGGFAFSAPGGTTVRATVTAKGRTADVELKPGEANLITLTMEP